MELYASTYSMRRAFFILVHSSMSAAIIHLVNISRDGPILAAQASSHLTSIIRMLHEMHPTYPIMATYFKVIRGLIAKWVRVIPPNVRDALHAIDLPSPLSSGASTSAMSPPISTPNPQSLNETDESSTTTKERKARRKPSAPDLIQMAPSLQNGDNASSSAAREFLWTPFPGSFDGIPVMPPERRSLNQNMDISMMLDSGVDGDWAQLNRDGFTMESRKEFWGV